MRADEVMRVVDALDREAVRYWLGGGWGVDALYGAATREHRDLDLAVDADTFEAARDALEALGFSPETDWLPVRLDLAGGPGGWVDLHPVRFAGAAGGDADGVQQGLDGATFVYPRHDLVWGSIAGRDVPCLSLRLQLAFHTGYDPRPQDLHDLGVLERLHAQNV